VSGRPTGAFPEEQLLAGSRSVSKQASRAAGAADGGGAAELFRPLRLRGLTLRNRVVKAATFEAGCDATGAPLLSLIAHHREVAAGGTALTVVAYGSVSADGRSFASQLLVGPLARAGLTALSSAVHEEGGAVGLQLTHAGSFSKPQHGGEHQPPIAPSRIFNPADMNFAREMTPADMTRVCNDFASAGAVAVQCGIDAIELHLGHGYLLSQFLSPYSNRRSDGFGGSIANRLRFPLRVVRAVRAAVGERVALLVKFNLSDGFVGGLVLDDAIAVGQALHATGCVDLLVPSGGWITRNGLFMLRGAVPLHEMVAAQPLAMMRWSLRLFGRHYVPTLPWREHFFEEAAL
jgi:2,4-dienoyl-CoA reductase-like NADH-dependent reductase (Old Yellow Enzyme family)